MSSRAYKSALRADQAAATRDRILDAVGDLLRSGDRELGYTAIARAARVSIPTVYRHFPTRHDLFHAMHLRLEPRLAEGLPTWTDRADAMEAMRGLFRRFDDPADPDAQAGRLHVMWEMSRATTVPLRRRMIEELVDREVPGLGEPHRTWLVDLGVVLASSATAEAMRGYLDVSGEAAADRVAFGFDALFAHAATLTRTESP